MDTPLRIELWEPKSKTLAFKTIDGQLASMATTRKSFWGQYESLVENYCERDMTNHGDIYDAFQGIAEALGRISGENFHWGHPKSRLGVSLAWNSPAYYHKLRRRTTKTNLPMTSLDSRVAIPSWSWMGWLGAVQVLVGEEHLET